MDSPDLSVYSEALYAVFERFPPGKYCEECAVAICDVLQDDYRLAIVTLQNESSPLHPNFRPPYIEVKMPHGETILLSTAGFHQVVRIEESDRYIDALSFAHYGLRAVSWQEYRTLFEYGDAIEITHVQAWKAGDSDARSIGTGDRNS